MPLPSDPFSFNRFFIRTFSSRVARLPFSQCPSEGYINSSSNVHLLNLRSWILPCCPPASPDSAMSCGRSLLLLVATMFATIPPLLNGAILEKRPFILLENPNNPLPAGLPGPPQTSGGANTLTPTVALVGATPAIPMTSIAPPEITAPPPLGAAACTTLAQCRLYYQVSNSSVETYTAVLIDHSS